jgi:hypothetical protein
MQKKNVRNLRNKQFPFLSTVNTENHSIHPLDFTLCQFKDWFMTRSETEWIVMPIFFLDIQCPVFQEGNTNMLATVNIQKVLSLHDYAISFYILASIPSFLCSYLFAYISTSYFIPQRDT